MSKPLARLCWTKEGLKPPLFYFINNNTMIDEKRTLEIYGYTSDELKPKSHKKIVVVCEKCNKIWDVSKSDYRDHGLCHGCAISKGKTGIKLTPEHCDAISKSHTGVKLSDAHIAAQSRGKIGHEVSDKTKKILSDQKMGDKNPMFGKTGEDHPMFGKNQTEESCIQMSATKQNLSVDEWTGYTNKARPHITPSEKCLKMNERFLGSHAHHITKSIVAFIPSELHSHIKHNLSTGSNMGEMNVLAIQFINGGL